MSKEKEFDDRRCRVREIRKNESWRVTGVLRFEGAIGPTDDFVFFRNEAAMMAKR